MTTRYFVTVTRTDVFTVEAESEAIAQEAAKDAFSRNDAEPVVIDISSNPHGALTPIELPSA